MIFGGPGFTSGFIVGFGTGFVSRELVQVGSAVAKPMARALMRAGITAYEKGRESMAQVSETFEDLVAEVRSGMGRVPQTAGAAAGVPVKERQDKKSLENETVASAADEHKKKKGSSK